jgi:hypothetical protein
MERRESHDADGDRGEQREERRTDDPPLDRHRSAPGFFAKCMCTARQRWNVVGCGRLNKRPSQDVKVFMA